MTLWNLNRDSVPLTALQTWLIHFTSCQHVISPWMSGPTGPRWAHSLPPQTGFPSHFLVWTRAATIIPASQAFNLRATSHLSLFPPAWSCGEGRNLSLLSALPSTVGKPLTSESLWVRMPHDYCLKCRHPAEPLPADSRVGRGLGIFKLELQRTFQTTWKGSVLRNWLRQSHREGAGELGAQAEAHKRLEKEQWSPTPWLRLRGRQ